MEQPERQENKSDHVTHSLSGFQLSLNKTQTSYTPAQGNVPAHLPRGSAPCLPCARHTDGRPTPDRGFNSQFLHLEFLLSPPLSTAGLRRDFLFIPLFYFITFVALIMNGNHKCSDLKLDYFCMCLPHHSQWKGSLMRTEVSVHILSPCLG